jgi:hypothetical protein
MGQKWRLNHLSEALADNPALERLIIDGSIIRVHQHSEERYDQSKAKAVAD